MKRVLEAIASGQNRILLTLATGTGKTSIAFQILWKLFAARWNLSGEPTRRPRILFLADRNNLADQAFNDFTAFAAFEENALARIEPDDLRKKGRVPTNASVFLTIFQTFMSGPPVHGKPSPWFGQYPADFFDFIVIDECHRGGANNDGFLTPFRVKQITTLSMNTSTRPMTQWWKVRSKPASSTRKPTSTKSSRSNSANSSGWRSF